MIFEPGRLFFFGAPCELEQRLEKMLVPTFSPSAVRIKA